MALRKFVPVLQRSSLFEPLRTAYLRTFKRAYWETHIGNLRSFYRQFVTRDSLVFDVGANVGEYTRAFLHLGAKVVAVEPSPELVADLRNIRNNKLTVVPLAMGREHGRLPLSVSAHHHLNSLVPSWARTVGASDVTVKTIDVEVSTLDTLIEKYGMPDFIKIDVEGYELQVLEGLTKFPKLLSFEFHAALVQDAAACVLRFPSDSRFNFFCGEPGPTAALRKWIPASDMLAILTSMPNGSYGDILVR